MARIELTLVEKQHDKETNRTSYTYPTMFVDPDIIGFYLEVTDEDIIAKDYKAHGAKAVIAIGKQEFYVAEDVREIQEKELQCNLGVK